jgi:hypothetical protein
MENKQFEESKEQEDSPIDFEAVLQSATIYGRPLSTFLLPDQIERLAEYLSRQISEL